MSHHGLHSTVPEGIRRARCYLLRAAEPPAPALRAFTAEHGAVKAAELVRAGDVPPEVAAETAVRREIDRVDRDFARAQECGARLMIPEDPEWPWPRFPVPLTSTGDAAVAASTGPLALWVRTDVFPRLDRQPVVAITGARAATAYGATHACDFAYHLAQTGIPIVSGGSWGIDSAAHRGALAARGQTVAVLPGGIDRLHPAGNRDLLASITAAGALVSEYPPGVEVTRQRLFERIRLLVALATHVVIVEAGPRSTALYAAGFANQSGRPVMAVPGPISSLVSRGCHDLIRSGQAKLVAAAEGIVTGHAEENVGITDIQSKQ